MMKGAEESLSQTIFLIGSFAAAAILIYLAAGYLSGFNEKEGPISGGNDLVIGRIESIVKSCLEENQGRKTSAICFQGKADLTGKISGAELISELGRSGIREDLVEAEDMEGESEIIISYRDGKVFIENK